MALVQISTLRFACNPIFEFLQTLKTSLTVETIKVKACDYSDNTVTPFIATLLLQLTLIILMEQVILIHDFVCNG